MPKAIKFCKCGSVARFHAGKVPVCGVCARGKTVVVIQIKRCDRDSHCCYWSNGKCIVYSCVKGN